MGGREDEQHGIPNPETGAGIGATAESNSFEPEEAAPAEGAGDDAAAEDPPASA